MEGRFEGCGGEGEGCGGRMRMDPHNMVKYKAHMPHRSMHHTTHVHIRHPLHTSTIPSTHLHYSLHIPPPSPPPSPTHLHHPIHTPLPFVCLPAVYIAPITTSVVRYPVRATPINVLRQINALRQFRHTLCAKSDLVSVSYVLRQIRFGFTPYRSYMYV